MLFAEQRTQVGSAMLGSGGLDAKEAPGTSSIWYTAKCDEKEKRIEHRLLLVRLQRAGKDAPNDLVGVQMGLALCIHLSQLDPERSHLVTYKDEAGQTARIIIAPRTAQSEIAVLNAERRVLLETVTVLRTENDLLKFREERAKQQEERVVREHEAQLRQLEREHLNALTELNELKQQLELAKAEEMCVICYENPRKVVYQCGHRSVCSDCDRQLEVHDNRCPLCRADIVLRIVTL